MNFDQPTILAMKTQLMEVGYANDEQFLGSSAFEHMRKAIFEDLREVGYTQSLYLEGRFFPEDGAVYWFYDPDMITREEAIIMTEKWVKQMVLRLRPMHLE